MKVKELKKIIENFEEDSEVVFIDYEPVVDVVESWDSEEESKSYCVITDREV